MTKGFPSQLAPCSPGPGALRTKGEDAPTAPSERGLPRPLRRGGSHGHLGEGQFGCLNGQAEPQAVTTLGAASWGHPLQVSTWRGGGRPSRSHWQESHHSELLPSSSWRPHHPRGLDEGPRQPLRGLARSLGAPGRSLEGGPVT